MAKRKSVVLQIISMIRENKAYWLIPVIAVFLSLIILSGLASLGGGSMAPFVYTLF